MLILVFMWPRKYSAALFDSLPYLLNSSDKLICYLFKFKHDRDRLLDENEPEHSFMQQMSCDVLARQKEGKIIALICGKDKCCKFCVN